MKQAKLAIVLALSGATSLAAKAGMPLPKNLSFFRQSALLVPKTDVKFVADGTIGEEEQAACAELRRLVTFAIDAQGDDRTAVYLAHTGRQFYIGFRIRRLSAEPPRTSATANDSSALWKRDDGFEIRLDTRGTGTELGGYDFIGNAGGLRGDASYDGHSNIRWSHSGWTYGARKTGDGWEGEFLFGADVFGLEGFRPGLVWRADLFNNAKTELLKAGWAYLAGSWHFERRKWPRIVFGGEDAAYQSGHRIGNIGGRRVGLVAELCNRASVVRGIRTWAAFYRLKKTDTPFSYYERLKGLLDTSGVALLPGATPEQLLEHGVRDILSNYVEAQRIDEEVSVEARSTHTLTLRKPALPGTYLVAYCFTDQATGQLLSGDVYPFTISPPLKTDIEYYLLMSQEIVAKTVVSQALARQAKAMAYEVVNENGRVVATERIESPAAGVVEVPFSTAGWAAGGYRLEVVAFDGAGKAVSRHKLAFEIPEPPFWWQSDAGKQVKVPKPWTRLEASEKAVSMWGRTYSWDDGPLPAKIVSQERGLLAAPAQLKVKVGGVAQTWQGGNVTLESAEEDVAVYRFATRAGDLMLKARTQVEFDGMMRFDWDLSSPSAAQIDELTLEIPVRCEAAELLVTAMEGDKNGKIGDEPILLGFSPSVVLRNSRVGIEWFAEQDWYWSNGKDEHKIEIVPQDGQVLLRVRFVSKPVRLTKPRRTTFGLTAWPVKPWPAKRFNLSNYLGRKATWEDGIPKAVQQGLNVVEWFHWNTYRGSKDYPVLMTDEILERVRSVAEIASRNGAAVIGHTGYALPTWNPDFQHYGLEMVLRPFVHKGNMGYKFVATPVYTDAYVTRTKKLAIEVGWSGMQSDGGLNPRYSENVRAGFAIPGRGGKVRGSYPIFAYRELTRRLWNVFHEEVEFEGIDAGFITSHTYHPYGAVHGFVDTLLCGESRRTWGSFKGVDRELERALYATRSFGVPRLWLLKKGKALHGGRGRIAFAWQFNMNLAGNRVLDYLKRNDYRKESYPLHRIWAAKDWVDARADNFLGYWENAEYVAFSEPDFLAGFYLQPGRRVLLGITNWLPDDREVEVALNLRELAFTGEAPSVVDAITDETLDLRDGKLKLDVAGDGYRLLKIVAQ